MNGVCLAIMAKAPAEVVLRAIDSAKHLVDSVCLVVPPGDPNEFLEIPVPFSRIVTKHWAGHAATRTATLRHAESDPEVDWVLMIDAHSTIRGELPPLDDKSVDAYEIAIEAAVGNGGRWRWMRGGHLMRARKAFAWRGIGESNLHETLIVPEGLTIKPWPRLILSGNNSGTRSYVEDAKRLGTEVDRAWNNLRRASFYHAQSLKDAGRYGEALVAFLKRAELGGWDEEVFWAKLWAAKIAVSIPGAGKLARELAIAANAHSPNRAEPLRLLEELERRAGDLSLAEEWARAADSMPYPETARLFVDVDAYHPTVRPA